MIQNYSTWLNESDETLLYPLKMLSTYKDKFAYNTKRDLNEGDIVYFQNSRYKGTIIIKGYKSVRDRLPGKVEIPDFPYTIHVTKPGIGGYHLTADILLPKDILQETLDIVEKYSVSEASSKACDEIRDVIERYSDSNAKKWNTEVSAKKFGL